MIEKPQADGGGTPKIELLKEDLHETLQALFDDEPDPNKKTEGSDDRSEILSNREEFEPKMVVVGGSTGAPAHLRTLLRGLPDDFPLPIVVVQHITEPFLSGLADNLDQNTDLTVRQATKTTVLEGGHVYMPGEEKHIILRPNGENHAVRTDGEDPVNSACPSVDVLFETAADVAHGDVIAVLFTGMGEDGAQGMKKLHDEGALCLAQNRETSTVYGMPAKAKKLGAVDYSFSPAELPKILTQVAEGIKT
jgi:two-component system chemotaxis response regulator CheB